MWDSLEFFFLIFTLTEHLTFIESRMVSSSKGKAILHVTKIPTKCLSELTAPLCEGEMGGRKGVFLMGGKKVGMQASLLIMSICGSYYQDRRVECMFYFFM